MPAALRSLLAVIAGFITLSFVVGLLTQIAIVTLHVRPGQPTPGYLAINVLYGFLAALAAGYITGLAAGRRPVEHATALASITLIAGVISSLHYAGLEPIWYRWLMILAPPLLMLAGGYIVLRHERTVSR